jgi:glycosyltransferase involved in cell wall biosynthesis
MAAERTGLRILMTADTIGGVWPFAMELCAQLAQRGDRVLLAATGREPDAEQRAQAAAIDGVELHARPYRLAWMQDPWDDLEAAGQWLRELSRRFAPDVVHLNDLAHGGLPWPAPVLMTAHSCVCTWWQAVHGTRAPEEWDRYRAHVAANLHAVDRVVAPTRAMLEALVREHGAVRASEVIHNGREALAMADIAKEPFVLGAGRLWDRAKNLAMLDAVATRLPWPVYLAGDARHPDGHATVLAGASLLGPLANAELRAWMARAAIYALPARYEPFGLSALEAAQAGCTLVLGDIPSLREVWGSAALFVDPADEDALVATLHRLIGDRGLRRRMARRAQARAKRYTPVSMALRYRKAYLDLVAQQQSLDSRERQLQATGPIERMHA